MPAYNHIGFAEKTNIPPAFKKYFWDCAFNSLSLENYSFFITERLLRFGNLDSIEWLLENVHKSYIKSVVKKSRNLDPKTRNYWKIIFHE